MACENKSKRLRTNTAKMLSQKIFFQYDYFSLENTLTRALKAYKIVIIKPSDHRFLICFAD